MWEEILSLVLSLSLSIRKRLSGKGRKKGKRKVDGSDRFGDLLTFTFCEHDIAGKREGRRGKMSLWRKF